MHLSRSRSSGASSYQYEMMCIVYPPYADKNILIDFGIVEADE